MNDVLREKARRIRLLITDIDGVWTDTGVYYSEYGEVLKRFSIRDGMGVERLREFAGVETAVVSGENSIAVIKRAEKLNIKEIHLHAKDKADVIKEIMARRRFKFEEIAYIGDDTNDIGAMRMAGLSACPSDAMPEVEELAAFVCSKRGGHGAFREFAEMIIHYKNKEVEYWIER